MPQKNPTVFIVDDDPALRDAMVRAMQVAGILAQAFPSAEEFLTAHNPDTPGCLLLDILMPGMTGPQLVARLAERGRVLPIIILTGHGDVPTAVSLIRDGAFDFIEKPIRPDAIIAVIRRAFDKDAREREAIGTRAQATLRLARLSDRERSVLALLVEGKGVKEIAAEFGLSYKTVQTHRAHIMEKTGIDNLAELVRAWIAAGNKIAGH